MIGRTLIQRSSFITNNNRFASTLVASFDNMVNELPHREAVRYVHGNIKVSSSAFKKWTEAHANALLDMGIKQGDGILVWFPECAEKHVAMLSAAKLGAKVIELDPTVNSVT